MAYAKIANARFALYGTDTYPDATFTLRLAFGTVKGYQAKAARRFPPWTTIAGPVRARGRARQPGRRSICGKRWLERKSN